MNKTLITKIEGQRVNVLWSWPQNGDLLIRSVKDAAGENYPVTDHDRQMIYEDILDNIN